MRQDFWMGHGSLDDGGWFWRVYEYAADDGMIYD